MIYNVIMAGGRGERFWPLSRRQRPKQLLALTSDKTMLQETIDRILPLVPLDNTLIVTGEEISEAILKEIDYLAEKHLLVEPQGRNTLFAIGLAAEHIKRKDPEAVMLVLSADHLINPPERLRSIIKFGASVAAEEEYLITIGIAPTRAETGYGYIKLGKAFKMEAGITIYEVEEFTEKPRLLVAQKYYYGREHLWNSGMFIWSVKTILRALEEHAPEAYALLQTYAQSIGTAEEESARATLYHEATPNSVDFAVLEKASNTLAIRGDIIWDDVGSWNSLERYMKPDPDRNVVVGDAVLEDSYELTVYNEGEGLIACLGVSDLVVVRSGDLSLVAHKTRVDDIRQLLAKIGERENSDQYF